MRVALLANVDKELSLETKGGSELFTYLLAVHLAKLPDIERIHVFGVGKNYFEDPKIAFHSLLPAETRTYVKEHPALLSLDRNRPDTYTQIEGVLAARMAMELLKLKDEIDLIHNNTTSAVFNACLSAFGKPVLTTLHTNCDSPSILIPHALGFLDTQINRFATIANHQRKRLEAEKLALPVAATVYNGIDLSVYPLSLTGDEKGGLWIGRVSSKHNKGLKEAIIASQKAGEDLNAFAFVDDETYYRDEIEPLLGSPHIRLSLENTGFDEKRKAYGAAKYFLYPIIWEEPFGLIFLEAMACGTPVIAYARGAVPEIVEDGKTGFIVNPSDTDIRGDFAVRKTGIDGLVEAIARINSLSPGDYAAMRRRCREKVEEKFTIRLMAQHYLEAYKKMIQ